jgi:2,4-dienoyl-CoA reductase-like NADH-dependent reductase (Old Yellow Enzyme family)
VKLLQPLTLGRPALANGSNELSADALDQAVVTGTGSEDHGLSVTPGAAEPLSAGELSAEPVSAQPVVAQPSAEKSSAAGPVSAPSRVMFGPHETNLGRNRDFTDRHVAYYARRAAGGAGILVTEEVSVHPSDWPYERAPLHNVASATLPNWRSIADAVRATKSNTVVLGALGHSGGQGTSHWSQRELWAPSAVPEVASREVPKVMEQADIDAVVQGFAAAAKQARLQGLHGVEINAGQNSLIRQFLSGLTNMRSDEYGSDRLRFAREVLSAVRDAIDTADAFTNGDAGNIGDTPGTSKEGYPTGRSSESETYGRRGIVALRLCVDEMAPWAGIVPEAGAAIAVELAPFVDLITVVRGSIYTTWATQPDGHIEPGFGIDLARTVRTALRAAGSQIPVFAQGSIVDWGQAEWALDSEASDGVEMTRAQLADAELVNKLRSNQSARIRPCLLCNQTCKVRDNRSPIITCVVDPFTGHETEDQPVPTPQSPNARSLTIIGGGVAGMEAARVGALRGFAVTVIESSPTLGGITVAAARGSGRARLNTIVDWLVGELATLGVTVRCNETVSNRRLAELRATGEVIVTTGATTGTLPFTTEPNATIHHAADLLSNPALLGTISAGPVVLWDPIGGPIAISIAELLAATVGATGNEAGQDHEAGEGQEGRKVEEDRVTGETASDIQADEPTTLGGTDAGSVADGEAGKPSTITLVTPDFLVGEKLALTGDLAPSQPRLHGSGVILVKRSLIRNVSATEVLVEDRFSGVQTTIACQTFIACGHRLPNTVLDPSELYLQAGDRVAPRTIHEAILEGRRAALKL